MYTPLNQYFVVMEVEPQFWQNPDALEDIYVALDQRRTWCRWRRSRITSRRHAPLTVNHSGVFPSVTHFLQSGAGRRARRRRER